MENNLDEIKTREENVNSEDNLNNSQTQHDDGEKHINNNDKATNEEAKNSATTKQEEEVVEDEAVHSPNAESNDEQLDVADGGDSGITESMVNIPNTSSYELSDNKSNDITKSTVLITTSQIMADEANANQVPDIKEEEDQVVGDEAPVEEVKVTEEPVGLNDEQTSSVTNRDVNNESMIILQASTTSSNQDEALLSPGHGDDNQMETSKNFTKIEPEKMVEISKTDLIASKDAEDMENLVRGYEIPNFENSLKTSENEIATKLEEIKADLETNTTLNDEVKKPERRLEDETYQELLGNKSLLKKITQYGDDSTPDSRRPVNGQMVTISYEAYVTNDADRKLVEHNDNLEFILGDGDVVSGLDMVVSLMYKNEKCEVIAEPRHGYGSLGKSPDIPPNATLFYKIHLKDFSDLVDLNLMSPLERLSLAEKKKQRGNFHYNRQDFPFAIMSYKKGLKYFNEENLCGDEEEQDLKKFLELSNTLSINLALSYYKMNENKQALESLDQVLNVQSKHVKALYIKGKILSQSGETDEAIKVLSLCLQLDPDNTEVKKELTKAQTKHKIQYENEKKMYKKMISGVSNTSSQGNEKSKSRKSGASGKKSDTDSSFVGYMAAGLAIAVASIGIALFARYKNMF